MKNKAHQRYRIKDGTIVRGVTTIIGNNLGWNKNVLMAWARKKALEGKDPDKIKQEAADIGTMAHTLIEAHITKTKIDEGEFKPNYLTIARKCFQGYLDWEKENKFTNVKSEVGLVSEKYQFGGTIDKIGESSKGLTLVDFKTSSGIYVDHKIQVSAYHQLAVENGYDIKEIILLHLGKNGDFAEHKVNAMEKYWDIFKHCLALDKYRGLL